MDVEHADRAEGKSQYTLGKLIKLWMNGFVNFSVKPLRLATVIGTIFSIISFLFIIVLLVQKIFDNSIQLGWTSMMVAIAFFGGIQLIFVGLVGEYVGRIFISINKFPQYVVKDKKDGREK